MESKRSCNGLEDELIFGIPPRRRRSSVGQMLKRKYRSVNKRWLWETFNNVEVFVLPAVLNVCGGC